MPHYVHARLNSEESQMLEKLVQTTGESISALVREGIKFLYQKKTKRLKTGKDFLKYAGSVASGISDLSTNEKHMEGYGL